MKHQKLPVTRSALFFMLLFSLRTAAQEHLQIARFLISPTIFQTENVGENSLVRFSAGLRSQFIGIEGAPQSQFLAWNQTFATHNSFGAVLTNDQAGPLSVNNLFANYGYRIRLDQHQYLTLGISASMAWWRTNWSKVEIKDTDDASFQTNLDKWMPNAGFSASFVLKKWQLGFAIPRFFEYELNAPQSARNFKHFYAHASRTIALSQEAMLVPMVQIRDYSTLTSVDDYGTPRSLDIGASIWLSNQWTGGLYWRTALERKKSSDYALALTGGRRFRRLSVNAVWDIGLNRLQKVSAGSFELMLGYTLQTSKSEMHTPTPQPIAPPVIIADPSPVPVPEIPPTVTPKPVLPEINPSEFTVKGIVFDMTTGLPAENARVTITNTCGAKVQEAFITGADGIYAFPLSPDCCYELTAQKDGFKPGISNKICTTNRDQTTLHADLDLTK